LYGVHKTNAAAATRQQQELDEAKLQHDAEMAAQKRHHEKQLAAQRNDRFGEEVANLLGERWGAEKAAYELATNAANYYAGLHDSEVASEHIAELIKIRDNYTPQLNKVEQLAIRASLLTNDGQIAVVLDEVRAAARSWKDLVDIPRRLG
jgi:hypothetical protein